MFKNNTEEVSGRKKAHHLLTDKSLQKAKKAEIARTVFKSNTMLCV